MIEKSSVNFQTLKGRDLCIVTHTQHERLVLVARSIHDVDLCFISQFYLSDLLQIKTLAAELCLDRALVLSLLRNPPPNLLMRSLSIPDEPTPSAISTPGENFYQETSTDHAESVPKSNLPIHTMQENWSSRKRLKKAHLDTLERVYTRSKRPTVSKTCHTSIS